MAKASASTSTIAQSVQPSAYRHDVKTKEITDSDKEVLFYCGNKVFKFRKVETITSVSDNFYQFQTDSRESTSDKTSELAVSKKNETEKAFWEFPLLDEFKQLKSSYLEAMIRTIKQDLTISRSSKTQISKRVIDVNPEYNLDLKIKNIIDKVDLFTFRVKCAINKRYKTITPVIEKILTDVTTLPDNRLLKFKSEWVALAARFHEVMQHFPTHNTDIFFRNATPDSTSEDIFKIVGALADLGCLISLNVLPEISFNMLCLIDENARESEFNKLLLFDFHYCQIVFRYCCFKHYRKQMLVELHKNEKKPSANIIERLPYYDSFSTGLKNFGAILSKLEQYKLLPGFGNNEDTIGFKFKSWLCHYIKPLIHSCSLLESHFPDYLIFNETTANTRVMVLHSYWEYRVYAELVTSPRPEICCSLASLDSCSQHILRRIDKCELSLDDKQMTDVFLVGKLKDYLKYCSENESAECDIVQIIEVHKSLKPLFLIINDSYGNGYLKIIKQQIQKNPNNHEKLKLFSEIEVLIQSVKEKLSELETQITASHEENQRRLEIIEAELCEDDNNQHKVTSDSPDNNVSVTRTTSENKHHNVRHQNDESDLSETVSAETIESMHAEETAEDNSNVSEPNTEGENAITFSSVAALVPTVSTMTRRKENSKLCDVTSEIFVKTFLPFCEKNETENICSLFFTWQAYLNKITKENSENYYNNGILILKPMLGVASLPEQVKTQARICLFHCYAVQATNQALQVSLTNQLATDYLNLLHQTYKHPAPEMIKPITDFGRRYKARFQKLLTQLGTFKDALENMNALIEDLKHNRNMLQNIIGADNKSILSSISTKQEQLLRHMRSMRNVSELCQQIYDLKFDVQRRLSVSGCYFKKPTKATNPISMEQLNEIQAYNISGLINAWVCSSENFNKLVKIGIESSAKTES